MPRWTSSPMSRKRGGFMPLPTPGGVPVMMTSPGNQRHETARIGDRFDDREDHLAGVAGLHPLAIHIQPHAEVLNVGDLVLRHQPGADGREAVMALALGPLARPLGLELALGDIVAEREAGDMVHDLALGDILRLRAHDDDEFHLPVEHGGVDRLDDGVVRPGERRDRLLEVDRVLGDRRAPPRWRGRYS